MFMQKQFAICNDAPLDAHDVLKLSINKWRIKMLILVLFNVRRPGEAGFSIQ